MPPEDAHWCAIPGAMLAEQGTLWLHEPAWSNRQQLVKRLRLGTYDKPFVVDDGETRRLHFDLGFIQSEMSLADPQALTFQYTRKTMAFLLFLPRPQHVVIVGLGGGSLTKFCHRQLTRTRITTVEVDADVIALSKLFDLPRPSTRACLVHADARDYFSRRDAQTDIILMDGCDRRGTAPTLCDARFYRDARACLSGHGLMVVNVTGTRAAARAHLKLLSEVFERRVIVVDVHDCANRLAFAFNDSQPLPRWDTVDARAAGLTLRHGLDFQGFAQRLRQAHGGQSPRARR